MSETTPLLPQFARPSNQTVDAAKDVTFSLASAMAALRAGKMPTHEQFDRLIQKTLDSEVLSLGVGKTKTGRLSEEGARVIKAFRDVLESVRTVGEQKNGDNKIQEMIFSLSQVDPPTPTRGHAFEVSSSSTLPSRREMTKDSSALLASLQKILTLLVTSKEFRLVINQLLSLSTGMLADAAGAVAEKASDVEKQARETGDSDKPIDYNDAAQKGKRVAKGLVSGRIQGQYKEQALDNFEGLIHYFQETVGDDDEQKDRIFEKLKAVITDVQANPDYTQSIDTILTLIKKYGSKAEDIVDQATEKVKEDADQTPLQEALAKSKSLIEAFASNEPLDPVIDASTQIKDDIHRDERFSEYFSDVGNFLEACLKVEGYVVSQRAYRRSSALWEKGQKLLAEDETYKKDVDHLVSTLSAYGDALADDEATSDLAFKLERLSDELTIAGKHGINALKAESSGLYRDFVDVILPRAVGLIKEIPCPRVEFKSEQVDFVIDDISFESASFVPDNIRIVNRNDISLTQGFATFAADYDASLKLHVDGLRFHATDISYWLHKKSGFFGFEDQGLLDISFDRSGIAFDVTLENAKPEDRETFYVVKKVDVDISDLEYHISRNSSWMLYFSKPFVSGLLKKNLEHSLEAQITSYLMDADLQLYGLQNRAIAATNAKPSPMNYLKAIFSPSVFGSSSTTSLTQSGVVKHGRRGEYLLAIGVDEELFPGKAGPAASYSKRFIGSVKNAVGIAEDEAHDAKYKAKAAQLDAQREADKLGLHIKEYQRREAKKQGWKSSAFDVSV